MGVIVGAGVAFAAGVGQGVGEGGTWVGWTSALTERSENRQRVSIIERGVTEQCADVWPRLYNDPPRST